MNLIYIIGNKSINEQIETAISLLKNNSILHPDEEGQIRTYFMIYGNKSKCKEIKKMLLDQFIFPEHILESDLPYSFENHRYNKPTIFIHHSLISSPIPNHVTLFG